MTPRLSGLDRWRWIIGFLFSGVALAILLWVSDLRAVYRAIKQLESWVIVGVLGLLGISLLTRSAAWRIILKEKISLWKSFLIVNAGYFLNTVFPFRAGEVGRAILLHPSGYSFWEAFPAVVVERLFDLVFALLLFAIGLPFALEFPVQSRYTYSLLGLVFLGFLFFYLVVRYQETVQKWLGRSDLPLPGLRHWLQKRFRSVAAGLDIFMDFRRFLRSFLWMTISWGIAVLLQYWLLINFSPGAPLVWAMFGLGALSLGVSIPSSPGNLGIYEASLTLALSALGMDRSAAFAYALTSHALSLAVTTAFGSYTVGREGVVLGKIREVAQIDPEEIV